MNELSRLSPPKNSRKKRKRVGRGPGSGTGKTSGRGHKGQKARASAKTFPGFEGGQMPLQRRVPKRGFTPLDRKVFQIVNLVDLADLEVAEATPDVLKANGLIRSAAGLIKILGDGDLSAKITVSAHKFSKSARAKIEGAGGTCISLAKEVVPGTGKRAKRQKASRDKAAKIAALPRGKTVAPATSEAE